MRVKVLSALDVAKTQYYHFKAIIVAGMGLFTDAYCLFAITPVIKLIGRVYYEDAPHKYRVPAYIKSTMVSLALLGTVIGQLVFGRLGDLVGRRRTYGLALMLMVLSCIGCGLSVGRTRSSVLLSLGLFRFLLGLGIGGDYPLSATIMSEFANKKTRGSFIAAVFSMQGFGILASSTFTMAVCAIFERASNLSLDHELTPMEVDIAWRVILMFGAIPAGLTFYWRMLMPETARYTALVELNVQQAAKDMEKVLDVSMSDISEETNTRQLPQNQESLYRLFSKQFFNHHGRDLFACATTWFLVDIVFYSSNFFESKISHHNLPMKKGNLNAYEDAFNVAKLQTIVAICSTIPGYWFSVYFIDRIGRVKIQAMGFLMMAIVYLAIGIPYEYWDHHTNIGFMFLYGLTFFFANFGPNTTTFIVPAELFPARFRCTCHGIAGAVGKVGAIIGSVGFLWVSHDEQEHAYPSLITLGGVSILGLLVTIFFTCETKGRSLEENEIADDPNNSSVINSFINI